MKSFTKITKTLYKPIWVKIDFTTYSKHYEEIRERVGGNLVSCIKCDYKFKYGDKVSLASFKDIGNETLCIKCAEKIK